MYEAKRKAWKVRRGWNRESGLWKKRVEEERVEAQGRSEWVSE